MAELPRIQLDKPGSINAIVELPDGSLILGGTFSKVNGEKRRCIARIKPDGTLDPDWNPNILGNPPCVNALLLSGDDLYVGGSFYRVDGKYRRGICRLDVATGKVDLDWYPVADGDNSGRQVYALEMTPTGDALFVGGSFEKLGKDIVAVAKVSTLTGDVDPDWNPGMATGSSVHSMELSGGSLYIGGHFTEISGVTRNYIAKLGAVNTGLLDMLWNPDADSDVNSLVLSEVTGNLYAGGDFKQMGGLSRKGIARMDATGNGQVDSWNPGPVGTPFFIASVKAMALAGTKLYVGGRFAEIGGLARNNIARLNTSDATADAWGPDINDWVRALRIGADGNSVHVGGDFYKTGTGHTLSFASLEVTTGGLVPGFSDLNLGEPGEVLALAKNGSYLYFGGDFVRLNGQPRFFLGKLDSTTGQVLDWGADFDGRVRSLVVAADGSTLYVGGDFLDIGGIGRNRIARLSAVDASVVAGWNPGASSWVRTLLLEGNDLYAGGRFLVIGGISRHRIAKLAADTGIVDGAWNPGANNEVFTLALSGNDLYAGGIFTSMGSLLRSRLAKLDAASGSVDSSWVANADSTVRALLAKDGALYVGGNFTSIGGTGRNRIAKLDTANAVVDLNWNPDAANDVFSLALSGDGNDLYMGGWFNTIGGTDLKKIAKVTTATGVVDPDWNLYMSTSGVVSALLTGNTGVYAGGEFEQIGGKTTTLGHVVDGHLLTVTRTITSQNAWMGIITSDPEGINCGGIAGISGCERALVPGNVTLAAVSSSPELTIGQEWLSGCDSAGGTSSTCGVNLNANKSVDVSISCELYDFLPPDEPVTSMAMTCREIKANQGFEIGSGGRVMFQANSSVELGPGFRVSDAPDYFRVRMQ
ncbi:hypothetical protein [Thiolapillus sp.]